MNQFNKSLMECFGGEGRGLRRPGCCNRLLRKTGPPMHGVLEYLDDSYRKTNCFIWKYE